MAQVEIILRKPLVNYGAEADVVKVRRGFARNFLIPQGVAYEATSANLRHIEALKEARTAREAEERADAQALAARISKTNLNLNLAIGDGGKAFGSITPANIIDAAKEQADLEIAKRDLKLSKPIKSSGKKEIEVYVAPEITGTLTVHIHAETPKEQNEDEVQETEEKSAE